jgi:hypothetical protein
MGGGVAPGAVGGGGGVLLLYWIGFFGRSVYSFRLRVLSEFFFFF